MLLGSPRAGSEATLVSLSLSFSNSDLTWGLRATVHAPEEVEVRSLVKCNTEFTKRTGLSIVELCRDAFSLCCIHATESVTPVSYVHRVDSHLACNFRAEVLDPRNAVDIVQHFLRPMLITRAAALPRGVTYTRVWEWDPADHCPVLRRVYVQRSWLKICVNFLRSKPLWSSALSLIIKRPASCFKEREHVCLI
jgi:hypothetical protein